MVFKRIFKPKISVIIVSYNNRKFLKPCLDSLFKSDFRSFELILVDNGSTDGSVTFLREHFRKRPPLKIYKMGKNLGYARGNNLGAKKSRGEILFFLNPDTEIDPHCLSELVLAFNKDEQTAVVQVLLLRMQDRGKLDCSGGFVDRFGWSYKRDYDYPLKTFKDNEEIFYAMGAAMAVRRQVFFKLSGFDEEMFLYHEDIDFCWRVWLSGLRVILAPLAIVYHYGGGSEGGNRNEILIFHREKNHLITLFKNYSPLNLFTHLPLVYLLYLLSAFYFIFGERKYKRGLAYLKAAAWSFLNIPSLVKKRWRARRLKKIDDKGIEEMFLRNIVALDILKTIVRRKL